MSTPRSAWRIGKGSASPRSPSAICTLTRRGAQPARLAHQAAHVLAAFEQQRQQLAADRSRLRPSAGSSRARLVAAPGADLRPRARLECRLTLGRPSGGAAAQPTTSENAAHGLRHRRAVHRREGQLVRRGLPGRLHPPDARRARLRRASSSSSSTRTSASTATPASRPARSTPASPRTSSRPSGRSTPRSTPSTTRARPRALAPEEPSRGRPAGPPLSLRRLVAVSAVGERRNASLPGAGPAGRCQSAEAKMLSRSQERRFGSAHESPSPRSSWPSRGTSSPCREALRGLGRPEEARSSRRSRTRRSAAPTSVPTAERHQINEAKLAPGDVRQRGATNVALRPCVNYPMAARQRRRSAARAAPAPTARPRPPASR